MKVVVYSMAGEQKGDIAVSDAIFSAKINEDLMHRAVVRRLSNRRNPIAHTKTRGEVAMTTKKAFRQKGTGSARRGAKSTNLLRGGGVTHGPRNNANFEKDMPRKERRAALFSSLSLRAKEKQVVGLESFVSKEPKTKVFLEMLSKLPEARKYLFVIPAKDEVLQKSARNIPNVKVLTAGYINPYDVLHADKVVVLKDAFAVLESVFLNSTK